MKRSIFARSVAAAALASAALGAASAAHATGNVYFSVGVQGAPVYEEPSLVYVRPRPVYVEPSPVYDQRPVYEQRPVYAGPSETYVRPCPPRYDAAYERERAWRRAEWQRRWRHHHHDWDRDAARNGDWD